MIHRSDENDVFTIEDDPSFLDGHDLIIGFKPFTESVPSLQHSPNSMDELRKELDSIPSFNPLLPRIQLNPNGAKTSQPVLPTLDRKRVHYTSLLGVGQFGNCYIGTYTNENGTNQLLLIKTIEERDATQRNQALFLADCYPFIYSAYKRPGGPLQCLGVSLERFPMLAAFHYSIPSVEPTIRHINFKSFLLEWRRHVMPCDISLRRILRFWFDICMALEALHENQFVHNDLGCRAYMLKGDGVCIGEVEIPQDLYKHDYSTLINGDIIALRWMDPYTFTLPRFASERLKPNCINVDANIWSLGITLAETLRFGMERPFSQLHDSNVVYTVFEGCHHQSGQNINGTPWYHLDIPEPYSLQEICFPTSNSPNTLVTTHLNSTWSYEASVEMQRIISNCWQSPHKRDKLSNIIRDVAQLVSRA